MSDAEERIWWARVDAAAKRQGNAGKKARADNTRELLGVICAAQEGVELVGPFGQRRWQPVPPERRTPEFVARERRRLWDQLGRDLGVGAMPDG